MNRKTILFLSSVASAVLLMSVAITVAQSARELRIPTEWYQAVPSLIIGEQWSWDWTTYETVSGGAPYFLYKQVGDSLFLTWPGGPLVVAYRIGPSLTWMWKGAPVGPGGPEGKGLLMMNMTLSFTFTDEDIALTDEDNNYKGLRIMVDHWQDLYGLEDIGGNNYLWRGLVHQHFVSWAPKGSQA